MEKIFKELEEMNYRLANESRLFRVGLKETQNLAGIMKEYPELSQDATLAAIKKEIDRCSSASLSSSDTHTSDEKRVDERKEQLERLYGNILSNCIYRQTAQKSDEFQTWISQKKAKVDDDSDKDEYYYSLSNILKKEKNFDRRQSLSAKISDIHREGNPQLIELLDFELSKISDDYGYDNYIDYCQQKKRMNYRAFLGAVEPLLNTTRDVYEKHISECVEKKLGGPFKNIHKCHIGYLFDLTQYDRHFSKNTLVDAAEKTFWGMGISLKHNANIIMDLEERERKNPRACCYPAKVPGEVHLIITPSGGLYDYSAFLHESGHALQYAHMQKDLPYAFRQMPRSNANTEIYSFLSQNLMLNPLWYEKILGLSVQESQDIAANLILIDLFMIRRYIGLLSSQHRFFEIGDLARSDIYAEVMSEATGFRYDAEDYLFDMDSGFYSADYLRAWICQSQMEHYLESRFGNDWFTQKPAGDFLKERWEEGEKFEPETVIERLGMKKFDTRFLEMRYKKLETLKSYQQGMKHA